MIRQSSTAVSGESDATVSDATVSDATVSDAPDRWFEWQVPVPVPSLANVRWHWAKKHRLIKDQRRAVAMVVRKVPTCLPVVVELVRVAPGRALDSDNLAAAFKGIRDQVASLLRADDADPRIDWRYSQRSGKPVHAVIRIRQA